jgi:hypothetical protein
MSADPAESTPSSESRMCRSGALVLLLAGALRIAWALVVPISPVSDPNAYDMCARNLAAHNAFGYQADQPWAFWPVGTSFAYSLVYRLFDPSTFGYIPVAVFNVLLGIAMVALAMACARRWFGQAAALITGLILALWPAHIEFTTIIASETLFTALCLAGVLLWPSTFSAARLILAGIVFAAATYVRPTGLLLPIVLAGAHWLRGWRARDLLPSAASVAVAMTVMAACIAPWAVRNYHLFGRPVLISANGGTNLWMGNNADTTGAYQEPPEFPGTNEAERDALRGRLAREYILAHPAAFVARTAAKAVKLHATETIGVGWNLEGLKRASPSLFSDERGIGVRGLKALSTAYWLAVLTAGLGGIVALWRRAGFWPMLTHPTVVLWAYFTAVHAVIVIQDRYHLPATPMIAALASLPLSRCFTRRASDA